MRPVFHAKSDRLVAKAGQLEKHGVGRLEALKQRRVRVKLLRQTIAHLILGLGGEDDKDTVGRIKARREERTHHRCADD